MIDTVECPYCGHKNDMTDGLTDLPNDNRFDHECDFCEEEFEVYVEFIPYYNSEKIVYVDCDRCGIETRDPKKRRRVYPFPEHLRGDAFCHACYMQGMKEVYEKDRDDQ